MIKLDHINKFYGDLHVLKDVSLEVAEGEKLVIIGPSGSGKSTTVRCMNFLETPPTVQPLPSSRCFAQFNSGTNQDLP